MDKKIIVLAAVGIGFYFYMQSKKAGGTNPITQAVGSIAGRTSNTAPATNNAAGTQSGVLQDVAAGTQIATGLTGLFGTLAKSWNGSTANSGGGTTAAQTNSTGTVGWLGTPTSPNTPFDTSSISSNGDISLSYIGTPQNQSDFSGAGDFSSNGDISL